MLSAVQMGSTFALNVLQKLDHCFTITNIFFSVVLQGVADSESRFIFIDIGAFGKQMDGVTLSGSKLYHFLEDLESTLPRPAGFEGSGTEISFSILEDNIYTLKTYLMEPFAEKDISCEEYVFNCRLSQEMKCFECTFGILTEK